MKAKMVTWIVFTFLNLHASPWIVYGTTTVAANSNLTNPTPNINGVIGEVSILPYTVPSGLILTITDMQIEGIPADYSSHSNQLGLGLWLGTLPISNSKGIVSCTTVGGSHQNLGMNIQLSSGTIVNLTLMNNSPTAWADGWYMQGQLNPIE